MAFEIEHKYLVKDDSYKTMACEVHALSQGYLNDDKARTVRIRIYDDKGFITVKGETVGDTRKEFEYEIPLQDGREMLEMCGNKVICKKRYIVVFDGKKWEVDEFEGTLAPLVLAEIELDHAGDKYSLPPFIGENVTANPAYYNSNLIKSIEK